MSKIFDRLDRSGPLVFCAFATACAHVASESSELRDPGCKKLLLPLSLKYETGSVLMTAERDSQGIAEWSYFNENGARVLLERHIPPDLVEVTVFAADGSRRLRAGYRKQHDRSKESHSPHGNWELFEPDGSLLARAVFSNGEMLVREQFDRLGMSVPWTLGDDALSVHQVQTLMLGRVMYPYAERRFGIEGHTCTLVCLDKRANVVSLITLDDAPQSFREAAYGGIRRTQFETRSIGGVSVPACIPQRYHFVSR